jgi:hypothetical protein
MRRSFLLRIQMITSFIDCCVLYFVLRLVSNSLLFFGLPYIVTSMWSQDLFYCLAAETSNLGCLAWMYWVLRAKDNGLYFSLPVVDFADRARSVAELLVAGTNNSLVHLSSIRRDDPVVVLFPG